MCAPLTFAKCCSVFSFTGIVFLTIIGGLLQSQPLYIKGPEDPEAAAQGCYGGAGIYVLTLVMSIGYIWKESEALAAPASPSCRSTGGNAYGSVPPS